MIPREVFEKMVVLPPKKCVAIGVFKSNDKTYEKLISSCNRYTSSVETDLERFAGYLFKYGYTIDTSFVKQLLTYLLRHTGCKYFSILYRTEPHPVIFKCEIGDDVVVVVVAERLEEMIEHTLW